MAVELLLVDDEEDVTTLLSMRLSRRGYVCRVACSGEEALLCSESCPPHVIIMDVKMPGMGGMEALRCLRHTLKHVPVILLSGHADMETAVSAMADGAFGYLMKPVDFDELLFKIEDACAHRSLEI